jgi:hypothetical protein
MATRGKSINLFLMDGDPNGRIKVTLANWTGVAYKIPRTELEKCKDRDDLTQSGVYFLFGTSDDTGESVVYIGQAGIRKNGEGILYRLQEHKRNPQKDYWTEAIVFTTSNNSFGQTEISYLENRFCNLAIDAKRYVVKNGNDPAPGNITEEKESELEEFIEYAKIVMGTLGHKVLEPLLHPQVVTPTTDDISDDEQVFFIKRNGADTKGRLTSEGIVVLAGSTVRKDTVKSCPDSVKAARKKYKDQVGDDFITTADILFKSPSGASSFVLNASSNGYVEWKSVDGKTLKDVENSEVEVSQ